MNSPSNYRSASRGLMVCTILLVAAGIFVAFLINPFAASKRAQQAQNMSHIRQVKFALDGFATDFDGPFPNKGTGKQLVQPLPTAKSFASLDPRDHWATSFPANAPPFSGHDHHAITGLGDAPELGRIAARNP
ncbi:MAG: hypothetical protein OSB65_07360 [Roseibacillus sp.]|nr:hypothetical protein [Roseibacillus sp.]